MTKKLLCAISEDPNMFNGLRFMCRFFENKNRLHLTLLCMAAPDSPYCRWKAGEIQLEDGVEPTEVDKNWAPAIDEALRMLHWDGYKPENVASKCCASMICRLEDIVDEIESDDYAAVVMGRRGMSRLKDLTDKSLSRKLYDYRPEVPMWMCRKPDLNRKNVLLCLDGSESAFNMARHVATMLSGEKHLVTLCHIIKIKSDDRSGSNAIFNRCEEVMKEEGFDPNLLRYMIYPSDHVHQAILDNANWGKFAVVATGTTKNPRKRLLFGSITNFLVNELEGSVLWVHP